jgi:outer membrane protein assembly factor BamB
MHFSFSLANVLSLSISLASAAVIKRQSSSTTVYKFPGSGASVENIAVRPSGQLLLTRFDAPELWSLDPSTKAATKIVTFSDALQSSGITEVTPDVFAVVTGSYSLSGGNKAGSWGIWKVDFTGASPKATKVKIIPESGLFNGLTTLNNNTVLIGDGAKGAVYRLNMSTGEYSIAIQDATMMPPSGAPLPLGLDGLRYRDGWVYFTNIFKNTFHKVQVDATGKATGSITPIWTNSVADDFTFGEDGSAYVATNTKGTVLKVTTDGKITTAASAGGSTSCAFGRTEKDKKTLYIGTSSGTVVSVPIN